MEKKTFCLVSFATMIVMMISNPVVAINPNSYCKSYGFDGGCHYGYPVSFEPYSCNNDPCNVGANATYFFQSYGHHGAFVCCYSVENNTSLSWHGIVITKERSKDLTEPLLVLLLLLLLILYLFYYKKCLNNKTQTPSG